MKNITGIFFFILFFNYQVKSQGGNEFRIFSEIDSAALIKTKALLSAGIDTVIGFYCENQNMVPNFRDTVENVGIGSIHANYYLLYLANEICYITRFVSFMPQNIEQFIVLESMPIKINMDSSMMSVRSKLPGIENEQFLPFVTEVEENGVKGYSLGWETHAPVYQIWVSANNNTINKQFEEYVLFPKFLKWDASPYNVNYPFNSRLKLFNVFYVFKNLTDKLYNQFVFPK